MICLFSCFLSDQSLILSYSRYSLYLLKGGRCDDIGRHFRLLGNARAITCVLLVTWTWSPDSSLVSLLSWVREWISLENTDVSLRIVNHLSLHVHSSFLCTSILFSEALNGEDTSKITWRRSGKSVTASDFGSTVLGSNPAVAVALSPWTRLFTPIVPRRSLHISFY